MAAAPSRLQALLIVFVVGFVPAVLCQPASTVVRGVRRDAESRYVPGAQSFTCDDGAVALPFTSINDDFCDCRDGSDEPGTSACTNGNFYCEQRGFKGTTIPSSHVNDGVCDCCDGADEYVSAAGCVDNCVDVGAEWRAEQQEALRIATEGAELQKKYIEAGQAAKIQRAARVAEHKAKLAALEAEKEVALRVQESEEAIEEEERTVAIASTESDLYAALGIDTMSAEELRNLLVAHVRNTNTSAELVSYLKEAKGEAAEAAKSPEDAAEDRRKELDERDEEGEEAGDTPATPATPTGVHWLDNEEAAKNHVRPEAAAARESVEAVENSIRDVETEITKLEASDKHDYGPNEEFFNLADHCYELGVAQYTYKVCPFGSAKQDHTSLGTFEGWEDGYKRMAFKNGQHCWNGPSRSMTVTFKCGLEEAILSVDEPSTCTYTAVMATPAACGGGTAEIGADGSVQ